jgi:hypothetical protein
MSSTATGMTTSPSHESLGYRRETCDEDETPRAIRCRYYQAVDFSRITLIKQQEELMEEHRMSGKETKELVNDPECNGTAIVCKCGRYIGDDQPYERLTFCCAWCKGASNSQSPGHSVECTRHQEYVEKEFQRFNSGPAGTSAGMIQWANWRRLARLLEVSLGLRD